MEPSPDPREAEPQAEHEVGEAGPPAALASSWLVLSTAGLFIFWQFVLQSLPSVIRHGLVVDFSLTDAGLGTLSSSFYYPYMLLQLPAGLLVLRFGSRRLLTAGIILCIVASFVGASSREFAYVAAARCAGF